jgi:alginate O-acetyltransferase complex protein AlgI
MQFNSWIFFLVVVLTFVTYYFAVPKKWQLLVLIAANLTFYSWHTPKLLGLLLFSAAMDAATSFAISKRPEKRLFAVIGVVSELSLLAYFKYGTLLYQTFFGGGPLKDIFAFMAGAPLPIGISFYCFQGISMVVDTFKGEVSFKDFSWHRHLTRTVFFVSFFPHLIAGPIVKASEFMPQIGPKYFRDIHWIKVIKFLTLGFFFKVVCADNLSLMTTDMHSPMTPNLSGPALLVLLFAYSMQIFADFSGYSLIAVGLAALFGYRFPQNFNRPYIAQSFSEFWTRWHMSLSTFLRNYLYIPLGGNRKGEFKTYRNLFLVMFFGGLWHGAAWSYAVWGVWHGLWLMLERFFLGERIKDRSSPIGIQGLLRATTVFMIVSIGWILFRFPDFKDVLGYIQLIKQNWSLPMDMRLLATVLFFSFPIVMHHLLYLFPQRILTSPTFVKWEPCFYALVLIFIFASSGDRYEFIYFQF